MMELYDKKYKYLPPTHWFDFSVIPRLAKTQLMYSSELTYNLLDCWSVSVDHYNWKDNEMAIFDQTVTVLALEKANIHSKEMQWALQ